jgi:ribonuclease-3
MAERPADLAELAKALGYEFRREDLLADAVTHPSVGGIGRRSTRGSAKPLPGVAYERLEFLGDRVLGLVIAQWLLERFPTEKEGALTRRYAALVQQEALATVAERLGLGRFLRLAPSEEREGRTNQAILADACEAVIGALYLDGGLAAASGFIRAAWAALVDSAEGPPQDPKVALQEWAQGRGEPLPAYETLDRRGPAHAPVFEVRVRVAGHDPVTAVGSSKRAAEKAAATALLRRVGVLDE